MCHKSNQKFSFVEWMFDEDDDVNYGQVSSIHE